ncbi:MAG: HAD family phosphatase [Chlamydiota bacterium]
MDWIDLFDLFLFDFDGLLVDTESLHYRAYQESCAHFGEKLLWDFSTFLGYAHASSEELQRVLKNELPQVFRQVSWDVFYERKKTNYYRLLEVDPPKLTKGAASLLSRLEKEKKTAVIVTHSPRAHVLRLIGKEPILQTITMVVTREDYERPKPFPDSYLCAMERFPEKRQVVGFEDSFRGLEALSQVALVPVFIQKRSYPLWSMALSLNPVYAPSLSELFTENFSHRTRS